MILWIVLTFVVVGFIAFIMGICIDDCCSYQTPKIPKINKILGVTLPLLFISIALCFMCVNKQTGTGNYIGTVYATNTNTVLWDTHEVVVKTDLNSSTAITFAVPDEETFNLCQHLRGCKVRIKCYTMFMYVPWIGDTYVLTEIAKYEEAK